MTAQDKLQTLPSPFKSNFYSPEIFLKFYIFDKKLSAGKVYRFSDSRKNFLIFFYVKTPVHAFKHCLFSLFSQKTFKQNQTKEATGSNLTLSLHQQRKSTMTTGKHGREGQTFCFPLSVLPQIWPMFGDSLICVIKMEEVRIPTFSLHKNSGNFHREKKKLIS